MADEDQGWEEYFRTHGRASDMYDEHQADVRDSYLKSWEKRERRMSLVVIGLVCWGPGWLMVSIFLPKDYVLLCGIVAISPFLIWMFWLVACLAAEMEAEHLFVVSFFGGLFAGLASGWQAAPMIWVAVYVLRVIGTRLSS